MLYLITIKKELGEGMRRQGVKHGPLAPRSTFDHQGRAAIGPPALYHRANATDASSSPARR